MPKAGDILVFAKGDKKGQPIAPDYVPPDAPPVLARSKDSVTGIVRDQTDKSLLIVLRLNRVDSVSEPETQRADGILAYSAVCTHMGCIVDGWDADKKFLRCPCHKGTYDARQHGKVISGPPPRPLPVLPVKLQNGMLVVKDEFTARIGAP